MARSKNSAGTGAAAVFCLKRSDSICLGLVILALVAAGLLVSSWSPENVHLPVLGGTKFITDYTGVTMHAEGMRETGHVHVQNVVALPDEVLLLVNAPFTYRFPQPNQLTCGFGNGTGTTIVGVLAEVQGMDRVDQKRSVIRCGLPGEKVATFKRGVISLNGTDVGVLSKVAVEEVARWNFVAFESVAGRQDVVLFVKGIVTRRGHQRRVGDLRCVFDNGRVETKVSSAAQEVFRCAHPPQYMRQRLAGKKVTLGVGDVLMPSVTYYDSRPEVQPATTSKYFICSCTMVFNIAKFLKEWVMYHAGLGVERFFFYDNNSDDELKDVLEELQQYNVSRHFWPWLKSQEAGFSHCALRARSECTWMIYTDVDEFIFPKGWLRKHSRPLAALVRQASESCSDCKKLRNRLWSPWQSFKKVGQIFIGCRVFGPSGLTRHPVAGVTVGYTCRTKKLQRHKSIVLLEALEDSLLNVVHHFQLKRDYINSSVTSSKGVIYHFKYQVWDEFKSKFRRRVSAYVSDWKQERNLDSNDRAPGLGTQEIQPPNWRHRFCEVNDTELRNYVAKAFRRRNRVMVWQ